MWDLIVSVPDHCLSFYFEPVYCSFLFSFFFYTKSVTEIIEAASAAPAAPTPTALY